MFLARTLFQLDIGLVSPDKARELGSLGYLQRLGGVPGGADYASLARGAHSAAVPFKSASPAVAVFCNLLQLSIANPLSPLPLMTHARRRRGGAKARRLSL